MLSKVGVRGAAGITAALVFLGANLEWNSVKAVPVSTQDNVAAMCAKIDAQTYGYCCKMRLEPTCPSAGSVAARQSVPLKLPPHLKKSSQDDLQKVAIGRGSDDTESGSVTSVFVNGNTTEPGRGLAANNGGNGESGGAAAGNMGGGETDNGGDVANYGNNGTASD